MTHAQTHAPVLQLDHLFLVLLHDARALVFAHRHLVVHQLLYDLLLVFPQTLLFLQLLRLASLPLLALLIEALLQNRTHRHVTHRHN